MISRRAPLLVALACAALVMSGCDGSPAPTPSTSGPLFANEEEAFAAAEATYRAYVDALNEVDLSDPETFEPVFALTTGDVNGNERRSLSQMHADGWRVSGATSIKWFRGESYQRDDGVAAVACIDVSGVELVDSAGASQVSNDRRPVYALELAILPSSDAEFSLAIASSNAIEDEACVK